MTEEKITITKKEYDKLKDDSRWLLCLESAGVDNWDGCDQAQDTLNSLLLGQG